MYIKEYEFLTISIVNNRKKLFIEKITDIKVEIGNSYKIHWSLLKKSTLRRDKIKVICDGCEDIIEKRLVDIDENIDRHFCRKCNKIGDKNPMYGLLGDKNPNYGSERPNMVGSKNPSKRIEIRDKISKKNKLTTDEFINRLKERNLLNEKYDISLVNYIDTLTPIKIKCEEHGLFEIKPINLMGGSTCKLCLKSSKGEYEIENILIEKNIKYISQKTFEDCRGIKRALPFDFYLPDYNTCIEFDGIQHYKPIKRFGGDERFIEVVKNDNIKNRYCELNNIRLIRISYKEKKIINYILNKLKL